MRRTTKGTKVLAVGALLVASAFLGGTAHADTVATTEGCNGTLDGADSGLLTKSVTSVVDNHDGTFTIGFTAASQRPGSTTYDKFRDCAFNDANNSGTLDSGEYYTGTEVKPATLDSSGNISGTIDVQGNAGDVVCDRVALSGTNPSDGTSFTDKSNLVCTTLGSTTVPVGAVGALGLVGLIAAGLGLVGVRQLSLRRRGAIA